MNWKLIDIFEIILDIYRRSDILSANLLDIYLFGFKDLIIETPSDKPYIPCSIL